MMNLILYAAEGFSFESYIQQPWCRDNQCSSSSPGYATTLRMTAPKSLPRSAGAEYPLNFLQLFQPFNVSALQRFNPSTFQPFNVSTLQRFNPSVKQMSPKQMVGLFVSLMISKGDPCNDKDSQLTAFVGFLF